MLASTAAIAQGNKLFELIPASKTGIDFKNVITENSKHNALTYENLYNGGGVATGDINNDGLDDIYLIGNMQPNELYLNLGNLKFKNITASAGVGGRNGWKTGVAMVDINGDALLDIYVCYSGKEEPEKRRNQFFINKGNLTFEDQAQAMGLDDPSYSTQASFFDYDRDGDLDLFLLATNVKVIRDLDYEQARKIKHPYAGDKLFRNDNNHFTEVTEQAGILSNALGFGLGVAVSDLNKDGWPDVYISNDYAEPDYLYINNGDGTFTDKLTEYLQHISNFSMGSDISDFNNDGWPDIFTSDMLPEDNKRQKLLYGPDNYEQDALMVSRGFFHQTMRNMLHVNNGNGTFSEIGQLAGVSNTDWSWAPLFADYDNDGWKDLFVTNGYFRDYTNRDFLKYKGDYYFQKAIHREKADTVELVNSMTSTPVHNYIFKNNAGVDFTDNSLDWGFDKKGFSNGAAYSDLDNDGDLDLIVNNQNDKTGVYKNLAREKNNNVNYIAIKLKGIKGNTHGLNSKVYVYAGGKMQYIEQMPVRGYQSSVSPKLHVGVGSSMMIDSVKVIWLSGNTSMLRNLSANQTVEVAENKSFAVPQTLLANKTTVFSKIESPLQYRHTEFASNDFKRQPMLTSMLSTCGPVLATADVNGDGLTDVFAGGSKRNPGHLYIQSADGMFSNMANASIDEDFLCTDADAIFFDADGDNDQDLYVASGGYHDYKLNDKALQDRLYLNDSRGNFAKASEPLPSMRTAKSCVRVADVDKDGDLDIFAGGRVVPGSYPMTPESFLLLNDGRGHFTNVTQMIIPDLVQGGMITDAAWSDLNGDAFPDLIVVGEFMAVRIFINQPGKNFREATREYFQQPVSGLWNKLAVADFDHDGDADIIAGNLGLNSGFNVSADQPLQLVYQDFDKNGSVDPILTHYVQGKSYPFASRDEMLDQIYALRKKFTSYAAYSEATLEDLFSTEELKNSNKLVASEVRTMFFRNEGTSFTMHALPIEAQYAPVYAIEILDYNNDGNADIILAGNQHATRVRLGAIDANYGQLFEGDGRGNFKFIPQAKSGLKLSGDVKSIKMIKAASRQYFLAAINNNSVEAYQLNTK